MAVSQKIRDFWAKSCRSTKVSVDQPYQVWYFGHTAELAEELAGLVLAGRKTATASLAETNKGKPEIAPVDNGYSVVTDFFGEPLCVLQTSEIRNVPFKDVGAEFAAEEGEGDLSLEYWRRVHRECFSLEADEMGFSFSDVSIVCRERFRLLYPRSEGPGE